MQPQEQRARTMIEVLDSQGAVISADSLTGRPITALTREGVCTWLGDAVARLYVKR